MKISPGVKITGNGSSIWDRCKTSKKTFLITKIIYHNYCDSDAPYEIQLFGRNTEWYHYTDDQIEEEVNKKFKKIVQKQYPKYTIKCIGWSEQGMQPNGGWSFDVVIPNKQCPR